MPLNVKQLTDVFSKKYDEDGDKIPSRLQKWWDDLPYEGRLKSTAYWFNRKWRRYITDPYYNLRYGIPNLFSYAKIVWRDRPWDWEGSMQLMQKKFELMIPCIEKYGHHTDSFQTVRELKIAAALLERVRTDFYAMEKYEFEKRKFEFIKLEDKKGFSRLDNSIIWQKWDAYLAKYKGVVRRINKRDGRLPDTKESLVFLVGMYNEERANRILFQLLRDKLQTWWD